MHYFPTLLMWLNHVVWHCDTLWHDTFLYFLCIVSLKEKEKEKKKKNNNLAVLPSYDRLGTSVR